VVEQGAERNVVLDESSLRLSRACLGKSSCFRKKSEQNTQGNFLPEALAVVDGRNNRRALRPVVGAHPTVLAVAGASGVRLHCVVPARNDRFKLVGDPVDVVSEELLEDEVALRVPVCHLGGRKACRWRRRWVSHICLRAAWRTVVGR
jgi:hypothetical protein